MNEENKENIVRYWHAVELLQPQSVPKLEKRDVPYAPFLHDVTMERLVTAWSPDSQLAAEALPKGHEWHHTLYGLLYDSKVVADELRKLYGADQGYTEPPSRQSAMFALKFTHQGMMVPDSLVLSSEAWFLGRAQAKADWAHGFDEAQASLREQIKPFMGGVVSADALRKAARFIHDFLGVDDKLGAVSTLHLRFRSRPMSPNKPEPEDDPLNSFLLADLTHVAENLHQGITSAPLTRYLQPHASDPRLDLGSPQASLPMIERLMPDRYSPGCWPSAGHLDLVHSQQLAVNTVLDELAGDGGLLGINGPPGTGKTTLLRDLIAAIVTRRADVLATLGRASDAFAKRREPANDGGRPRTIHLLKPELFGFEIVVASSNNGAVENVTLELPQRDKIDPSWLPDAGYFAELGKRVTGQPAWGLISAALGSKRRRSEFVERYFFGDGSTLPRPRAEREPADEAAANNNGPAIGVAEPTNASRAGAVPPADNAADCSHGLHSWLAAQAALERSTEDRLKEWQEAVSAYKAARARVDAITARAEQIRDVLTKLGRSREDMSRQAAKLDATRTRLADIEQRAVRLETHEWETAHAALRTALQTVQQHGAVKPVFWQNLISLGRDGRAWKARNQLLVQEYVRADAEFQHVDRLAKQLAVERKALEQARSDGEQRLADLQRHEHDLVKRATEIATAGQARHLSTWIATGEIGRGEAIELAAPWILGGWRQARAGLFIQALKLHRTFFALEPKRLRSNLTVINSMLKGTRFSGLSRNAIRSAWASLFMVVPVLSSTFASFARSFGSISASEIGWLFVDEAGQATPQAAVGALWRSRRAVLVGDPLQLKPILSVSDAVLEHMRTRYGVPPHWLPNRQSAQTLADQATPWGRWLRSSDAKTWVGLPLVVHRRCDRPMFEIANRIAYGGAMVYGTAPPSLENETPASLPTSWIHAPGQSEGNWVPAEGEALHRLIARLQVDGVVPSDISIITPFRAVRDHLQRLRWLPREVIRGTIHTMQGKESAVVIIVLGGNTATPGARSWAVSEPNLLNVAATRAKRRLYVIGDADDWKSRRYFRNVMDLLPRR